MWCVSGVWCVKVSGVWCGVCESEWCVVCEWCVACEWCMRVGGEWCVWFTVHVRVWEVRSEVSDGESVEGEWACV